MSRGARPVRLVLLGVLLALAGVAVGPPLLNSAEEPGEAPSRPPVKVEPTAPLAWVDGRPVTYSPASLFVLPGETIHLDAGSTPGTRAPVRTDSAGTLTAVGSGQWTWTAPADPGTYALRLRLADGRELTLHTFVMVPEGEVSSGELNGYRIGTYPRVPLRGDTMYVRPDGFVEVTRENRELRVSPRFRLRHFETKQGGGFPRYVVLQRKLLTKLELIVDAMAARGYPVSSLHIMSGYRTPAYNRSLGNVAYSRHQWGDASDIFVDEDGDGWMDDLDGDGDVDRADARVIYDIVDSLDAAVETRALLGGLGIYDANSRHGPFVHVDTRGHIARW